MGAWWRAFTFVSKPSVRRSFFFLPAPHNLFVRSRPRGRIGRSWLRTCLHVRRRLGRQLAARVAARGLGPGCLAGRRPVLCEIVSVALPHDIVIQRLAMLKKSGRFEDARSFPDGPGEEEVWAMHHFYFYDSEHQYLVRMEIPLDSLPTIEIHLAGMIDFTSSTEWVGFGEESSRKKGIVALVKSLVQRLIGELVSSLS